MQIIKESFLRSVAGEMRSYFKYCKVLRRINSSSRSLKMAPHKHKDNGSRDERERERERAINSCLSNRRRFDTTNWKEER